MGTARAPVVGSGTAPAWIWRVSKPQSDMATASLARSPDVDRRGRTERGALNVGNCDQVGQLISRAREMSTPRRPPSLCLAPNPVNAAADQPPGGPQPTLLGSRSALVP